MDNDVDGGGLSVVFCTTTGSSNVSPKFRKRGAVGRTVSGRAAVMIDSPVPNRSTSSTATASTRYLVRLSGRSTSTAALPFASVVTDGSKTASGSKSVRSVIGVPNGAFVRDQRLAPPERAPPSALS